MLRCAVRLADLCVAITVRLSCCVALSGNRIQLLCVAVTVRRSYRASQLPCVAGTVRRSYCASQSLGVAVTVRLSYYGLHLLCVAFTVRRIYCTSQLLCRPQLMCVAAVPGRSYCPARSYWPLSACSYIQCSTHSSAQSLCDFQGTCTSWRLSAYDKYCHMLADLCAPWPARTPAAGMDRPLILMHHN